MSLLQVWIHRAPRPPSVISAALRREGKPSLSPSTNLLRLCLLRLTNFLLYPRKVNSFSKNVGCLFCCGHDLTECSFGPVDAVVPYFERHGAVPPEGANPAEFVLETVGAGIHARTEGKGGEWSQRWKLSPEADATINELTNIAEHSSGEIGDGAYSSAFNASIVTQTYQLTQRILRSQWRNTPYIYSKIWVHVIQALLIGLTFYQLGTSPQELQNRCVPVRRMS
jgi:hypothetical protein